MSDTVDVTSADNVPSVQAGIPIALITESPVALRAVNKSSLEYTQLVQSIAKIGVLNSITVREVRQPDGTLRYGLVDGLQRFNAAKDAGLETIPANVRNLNDSDLLEAQIIANIHKIETRPAAYTEQLLRILASNPLLTMNELANRLAQSDSWLVQRLSLGKLDKNIQTLVDEGKIKLANAYVLAKLPEDEQKNFVDRAMTDSAQEFTPVIKARVKELRDAKAQGREPGSTDFAPVPHLRKIGDLKSAMNDTTLADQLCAAENATSPAAGFMLGLRWTMNMDSASVAAQKAKDDERKQRLAEEKERAKAEREAKKAEEAAKKQAEIAAKQADFTSMAGIANP